MADPDKVKIMPGVVDALCEFHKANYMLIVVTNQSGIARGCFCEEQMHEVNNKMRQLFNAENIVFDDILFCPHGPEDNCLCRKPKPKMLLEAAKKHNIDLAKSAMIGDKISDVEAGIAAGCGTNIWLSYGRERVDIYKGSFFIAESLLDTVKILCT